jgi:MFS family permease
MTTVIGGEAFPAGPSPGGLRRLWDRKLDRYPETGARIGYLGVTVLATVVLYYQLYIAAAVGPKIIHYYQFTFAQINYLAVIGAVGGAFASLAAGLADRWGRANLVVGGLLLTGLLTLFAVPNATSQAEYVVFTTLVATVEGAALVATPALIRDFSPQLSRGVAMAFWSLGPVLGSLVATEVASHTLASHPAWQYQFRVAGVVGLVVWVIALLGLRELAPRLRDQLMVSIRDRALVEARAAGIDPERLLKHQWRQMLRLDIIGPALGISLFLLAYFSFVFLVVGYFQTVFGYSDAKVNDLAAWFWIADAVALIAAGVLSDRLRVRKPFMIVGATVSLIGGALFAASATNPHTSHDAFVLYAVLMAFGGGVAYVAWMSAFTQTVEHHNPAATATGLAVWGWIIRIVFAAAFASVAVLLTAMSPLVDQGPRVRQIVATYPKQVTVLQTVDPATLTRLAQNPHDLSAQAQAVSQLSGLPVASVAKVAALAARYRQQLATAAALSPVTLAALAKAPTSRKVQSAAVAEIARKMGIPPPAAASRLRSLGTLPPGALAFLHTDGPKVQRAGAELASLSAVPPADLAYLNAYGSKVARAQKRNPGQWQTWWWICFFGAVAFIPLSLLLKGRWDPRKAREDELAHERAVEQELARLHAEPAESPAAVWAPSG